MISPWQLRPIQALIASQFFHERHIMLMMSRQQGKTEIGVRLGNACISNTGKTRQGIFLTKSREAAKKMTREKFLRIFDSNMFAVNTELIINKKNPTSVLYVDSVDKRPDKLRGGSYHFLHWAEVAFSEFDHGVTVHDVYNRVLKWTQSATNGYSILESTPNGTNGWKEMWEDENGRYQQFKRICYPGWKLVEMGLYDPVKYENEKRTTPRLEFEQEVECKFVNFIGRIYEDFGEHHIWNEMPPPQEWQQVFYAVDWGWHPSATCVLFAYEYKGRVCVFDEIYGKNMTIDQIMKEMKEKFEYWNIMKVAGVGDHDPRNIEELNRGGIACTPANKVNVLGNRMEIMTRLRNDTIFIHPRCRFTVRDISDASWDPKNEGEIDESKCTWGHFDAEAALRYLVRQFSGFEKKPPPELPSSDETSNREWILRGTYAE